MFKEFTQNVKQDEQDPSGNARRVISMAGKEKGNGQDQDMVPDDFGQTEYRGGNTQYGGGMTVYEARTPNYYPQTPHGWNDQES